jgi:hypothetical protein
VLCGTVLNALVLAFMPQVKTRGLLPCLPAGLGAAVLMALLGVFGQSWLLFGLIVPFLQRRFMNLLKFIGPAISFVVLSHYMLYSAVMVAAALILHTVAVAIFFYFYPQLMEKAKPDLAQLKIEGLTNLVIVAAIISFLNSLICYFLSLFFY